MVKQQDAIGRRCKAMTHQLVQIAGAKIEGETDECGELVVRKSYAELINRSLSHSQILLQESLCLLLRNGLARLHALSVSITYRPDADAVLVRIQTQALERFDQNQTGLVSCLTQN